MTVAIAGKKNMAFDQSTTEAILKVYVTDAIITVGAGGRGFLMETGRSPLVITAAQCLPHLPPSPGRHISSYGYANLLGPLGAAPTIWAECLFVDPIADVAVLCEPGSERIDEWDAFDTFIKDRPRLELEHLTESGAAWMFTLEGNWQSCTAEIVPRGDRMFVGGAPLVCGMSGSPILNANGKAVGVVNCSSPPQMAGGPNPVLLLTLPGWLLPVAK